MVVNDRCSIAKTGLWKC